MKYIRVVIEADTLYIYNLGLQYPLSSILSQQKIPLLNAPNDIIEKLAMLKLATIGDDIPNVGRRITAKMFILEVQDNLFIEGL